MRIALINLSKNVSADQLAYLAAAVNMQLRGDFCPAWQLETSVIEAWGDQGLVLAPGQVPLTVMDDPDQADALGWHSEDNTGAYLAHIFVSPVLDNGGDVLTGTVSVSSVASHEVLEMIADPAVDDWVAMPDGRLVAREVCDPVEANGYSLQVNGGTQVMVSNFVTPQWFDALATPPYDKLGLAMGAFAIAPQGYAVYLNQDGTTSAVFGERYPEWLKAQKLSAKAIVSKRAGRRALGPAAKAEPETKKGKKS